MMQHGVQCSWHRTNHSMGSKEEQNERCKDYFLFGENHTEIVISHSGATKDSLNCASLAKDNGAKVDCHHKTLEESINNVY